MWGICLDISTWQDGLYQAVIQYEMSGDNQAVIISPRANCKVDLKKSGNCQYRLNIFMDNRLFPAITPI